MADVILEGVVKTFGDTTVVERLDLEIKDGEFMVLLGPSGCGKTTILRMIAGLESVSAGNIVIGGLVSNWVHPSDRNIAMVFQNYALYPHMTVSRNLGYGLLRQGVDKREVARAVKEIAGSLGLEALLDRKPAQLSGGQRQRVALGRAVIRHPQVFLMDEPLSNLDAKLRVDMRNEVVRLQARLGTTTIYVTHDQVEAMTMGHRVAVMNQGRLEQVGSPLDLFERPRNAFVAGFMGQPSINMFRGSITTGSGSKMFVGDGIRLELNNIIGAGNDVLVGIRPQHLVAVGDGSARGATGVRVGQATVEFVEHLGTESFAVLSLANRTAVAAVDPAAGVSRGTDVWLLCRQEKVHVFDAVTGLRVSGDPGDTVRPNQGKGEYRDGEAEVGVRR
jgi:multiple sugar transport system ATP-binding protein